MGSTDPSPTPANITMERLFSLWDISKPDIETFIEQANLHHPTIKFTAEISDTETVILDTTVYKARDSGIDQSLM